MSLNDQIQSSSEKDLLNNLYVRWGLTLIAIAVGFLALDIMLRRPLFREVAAVQRQLADVNNDLRELVGVKDQAWESSHLLGALHAQKRQFEQARSALAEMREFRQRVEIEAQQTGEAVAALDRIVNLQQRVAGQRESVASVEQVLADVVKLHERLLAEKKAQQEAVASLNRVTELHQQVRTAAKDADQAAIDVQKLGDLRTKVLENAAGAEDAQGLAAELIALMETVRNADGIDSAQQAADQLLVLRETLRPTDDATDQSQAHAEKLLSLRDELVASADDTQAATRTWGVLKKLESDLRAAGGDVAAAVETLELLTDLDQELREQSQSLVGLRKSLMDIVMLETTIGRALRVLEPLAQLKNLTRLSDSEVRAAARAILDQRGPKLTRREPLAGPEAADKLPHEDTLFQEEPSDFGLGLVPPPRDLAEEYAPAPPARD